MPPKKNAGMSNARKALANRKKGKKHVAGSAYMLGTANASHFTLPVAPQLPVVININALGMRMRQSAKKQTAKRPSIKRM